MISSTYMGRRHGWGPKKALCAECAHLDQPDPEYEAYCTKGPKQDFVVGEDFRACALFEMQWTVERRMLEAQGQRKMAFMTMGRPAQGNSPQRHRGRGGRVR